VTDRSRILEPGVRGERGAALLLVLFVLLVAWTATLLASVAISIDLRSERADQRRVRLTVLADSALAEALAALAGDPYAAGRPWHPFGGGEIRATIGDVDDLARTVTAAARAGGVERTVVARVVLGGGGPTVTEWRVLALRPIGTDESPPD
jgi:hypothetical protein